MLDWVQYSEEIFKVVQSLIKIKKEDQVRAIDYHKPYIINKQIFFCLVTYILRISVLLQ